MTKNIDWLDLTMFLIVGFAIVLGIWILFTAYVHTGRRNETCHDVAITNFAVCMDYHEDATICASTIDSIMEDMGCND